jgi:hypothetical protein
LERGVHFFPTAASSKNLYLRRRTRAQNLTAIVSIMPLPQHKIQAFRQCVSLLDLMRFDDFLVARANGRKGHAHRADHVEANESGLPTGVSKA